MLAQTLITAHINIERIERVIAYLPRQKIIEFYLSTLKQVMCVKWVRDVMNLGLYTDKNKEGGKSRLLVAPTYVNPALLGLLRSEQIYDKI